MLTEEIRNSIKESVLCWLATADENGCPNVSPKEMFMAFEEDKVLIANIASPESVKNIKSNPNVCVSFVHIFKQKGFKLAGEAQIIEGENPSYSKLKEELYSLGGRDFEIKSVVQVTISKVSSIVAPSYWLFPETTESSQIEQSLKTYGVSRENT